MRRALILIALTASSAQAATLSADSLLCESVTDLEFVNRQDQLKGQPASVVLKRANGQLEFYKLRRDAARLVTLPKQESDQVARADEDAYKSLVASCAASAAGPATVLERKAISGFVKVRTPFQGKPAELWTYSAGLSE